MHRHLAQPTIPTDELARHHALRCHTLTQATSPSSTRAPLVLLPSAALVLTSLLPPSLPPFVLLAARLILACRIRRRSIVVAHRCRRHRSIPTARTTTDLAARCAALRERQAAAAAAVAGPTTGLRLVRESRSTAALTSTASRASIATLESRASTETAAATTTARRTRPISIAAANGTTTTTPIRTSESASTIATTMTLEIDTTRAAATTTTTTTILRVLPAAPCSNTNQPLSLAPEYPLSNITSTKRRLITHDLSCTNPCTQGRCRCRCRLCRQLHRCSLSRASPSLVPEPPPFSFPRQRRITIPLTIASTPHRPRVPVCDRARPRAIVVHEALLAPLLSLSRRATHPRRHVSQGAIQGLAAS